ncbi:uncharacterized protein LOC135131003 [Zophobas morio]|uniref:uncharacterized protein LOC135131003 n=1 Tax=Zophobas morio TaxID=2755281 RepID=UPI0030837DCB
MKTLLTYSFVIFAAFFIHVQTTQVDQCQNIIAPLPLEVDIVNCIVPSCVFYINSTGVMNLKFIAPRYLENIAPAAVATVAGLNVSYPLQQPDACVGITNTPCPLAEGEYVEYTYSMFVLPLFPQIDLELEFSLQDLDRHKEPFVCFRVALSLK